MQNAAERLYSLGTLLAAVAIFPVFGGLLYLEGRPGWCKYGFGLLSAAWSHCTSQHFVDPYSLTHVLHGIIFFGCCDRLLREWAFSGDWSPH
jgi:hypothetical protein